MIKNRVKLPLALLILILIIFILTGYNPAAGRLSWLLEVIPAMIGIVILIITYRKFPMSSMVYWCVFLHTLILVYGGYYTYALTPLGNYFQELFNLSRNHYDRVGHLALGFFPVFIIKEVLLRKTRLIRDGWFYFIVLFPF